MGKEIPCILYVLYGKKKVCCLDTGILLFLEFLALIGFFIFQASDAFLNLSFFWTKAMVTDLISSRERRSKGKAVSW